MDIKVGLSYTVEKVVGEKDTASEYGSGAIRTFATPAMVAIMENAAMSAVAGCLDEGYTTVGTKLDVSHVAATPVGMKVVARAELLNIDGKRLTFRVEADDECGLIGEGTHERYIVNTEKFTERLSSKKKD